MAEVSSLMVEVAHSLGVRMELGAKGEEDSNKEEQEVAPSGITVKEGLVEGVGHTGMEGELEGEEDTQVGHQVITS